MQDVLKKLFVFSIKSVPKIGDLLELPTGFPYLIKSFLYFDDELENDFHDWESYKFPWLSYVDNRKVGLIVDWHGSWTQLLLDTQKVWIYYPALKRYYKKVEKS